MRLCRFRLLARRPSVPPGGPGAGGAGAARPGRPPPGGRGGGGGRPPRAEAAALETVRRLRLAAQDMRSLGIGLLGQAEALEEFAPRHAPAINAAAADLLDIADELQDAPDGNGRHLEEMWVPLTELVDEAVAMVSASLAPGRRCWRIAEEVRMITVAADRRALRHAFTRVFTDAVRGTRQDDWIDISMEPRAEGCAIIVADEGPGAVPTDLGGLPGGASCRGLRLRLALARELMVAHGGALEVEGRPGIGTRVALVFPSARLRRSAVPAAVVPGAVVPGASYGTSQGTHHAGGPTLADPAPGMAPFSAAADH